MSIPHDKILDMNKKKCLKNKNEPKKLSFILAGAAKKI